MTDVGVLVVAIVSCSVGMTGVLGGVVYFTIGSLRREMGSLRTELTAVIKAEFATLRTEEFKQKLGVR